MVVAEGIAADIIAAPIEGVVAKGITTAIAVVVDDITLFFNTLFPLTIVQFDLRTRNVQSNHIAI